MTERSCQHCKISWKHLYKKYFLFLSRNREKCVTLLPLRLKTAHSGEKVHDLFNSTYSNTCVLYCSFLFTAPPHQPERNGKIQNSTHSTPFAIANAHSKVNHSARNNASCHPEDERTMAGHLQLSSG